MGLRFGAEHLGSIEGVEGWCIVIGVLGDSYVCISEKLSRRIVLAVYLIHHIPEIS